MVFCPFSGINVPRPAYKPHSVLPGKPGMGDHLSGTRLSVCLLQLTRDNSFLAETGRRAASREPAFALSLLSLAPGGGCLAAGIAASAGGLLHRLFTLTLTPDPSPVGKEFGVRAVIFCGPIRQV
jgi:hypothetical protein